MAKYLPSACNRQYFKVHYYPIGKMKENVINFSVGRGGIYLKGVNIFIITYDTNGLQGTGRETKDILMQDYFQLI